MLCNRSLKPVVVFCIHIYALLKAKNEHPEEMPSSNGTEGCEPQPLQAEPGLLWNASEFPLAQVRRKETSLCLQLLRIELWVHSELFCLSCWSFHNASSFLPCAGWDSIQNCWLWERQNKPTGGSGLSCFLSIVYSKFWALIT